MTNDQRRKRIAELKELLSPLNHDKIIASLRHNFFSNPHKHLSAEEQQELEEITQTLKDLNGKISPIFKELRSIQVKYFVEYDGEVLEGGSLKTVLNKKEFYLSTDADIDSFKERPDFNNSDVWAVLNEIKDYIYFQEYSRYTIQHIKRIA